jgi:hypothetical protein
MNDLSAVEGAQANREGAPRKTRGTIVSIANVETEILQDITRERDGDLIEGLRPEVTRIAAISRGWTSEEDIEAFGRMFNIGPLYEASTLALLRKDERLVGIAGTVNDWQVDQGSIVHLCSLGFLPEIQGRDLMTSLMGHLWRLTLRNERVARDLARGRVYFTAITQSPYIIGYLHRFAEIVPSPYRALEAHHVEIARHVVARFDPHLQLEEGTLALRGEAQFHYCDLPLSRDKKINRFCQAQLNYERGDVFAIVGRVLPARVEAVLQQLAARSGGEWFA